MQNSLSSLVDNLSEIDNKIIVSQEILIKIFPNTYQLCNKDLLRKGVYPYEYMYETKNIFIPN